jgi:biotin transport system substrate-specific component
MNQSTYVDVLVPRAAMHARVRDVVAVLLGSALVALCAQIAIPLPFTPVPITGQTFAVLIIGAVLGSKRGSLALIAYLAEGAAGLPVFAGWQSGIGPLLGPTGGYLIGFVGAAYAIGWLAERGFDRNVLRSVGAMFVGKVIIFACGMAWLSFYVGPNRVVALGLMPFLPGAVIKVILAALVLPAAWRWFGRKA